jgi:uncharacterized protein YutE (UPF0331/DUF86 family)
MVRPDVVGKKLARAAAWLDGAEERLARPVLDAEARDLAAFYLFLAIQESIDLAAHWVADARWGSPDEAGATFELLADRGAIDRDLAARLRGAVGLRNRIAHGYSTVDHGKVQSEYQGGVATLRTFLSLVAEEAGL